MKRLNIWAEEQIFLMLETTHKNSEVYKIVRKWTGGGRYSCYSVTQLFGFASESDCCLKYNKFSGLVTRQSTRLCVV